MLAQTVSILSHRLTARIAVAGLIMLGFGACAQEDPAPPVDAPAFSEIALDDTAASDPPGAALPLSIGGRVDSDAGDERTTAINCAAALGLTAQRLAGVTDNASSNEIALIGRAEDFFIARAGMAGNAGAGAGGGAGEPAMGSIEAAVARRREEKSAEITQQAQLAIACLRRFGDSVDPQTGLVL